MNIKDWYRRTTWTPDDKQDFFAHLSRARKINRAQYLRIQAIHLMDTGNAVKAKIALELLDLLLKEYPHPTGLELAYDQKARCLESLGRLNDAVDSYRLAFQARRATPNVRTYAPLNFGMFVIRHNRTDLYNEAQSIFNELVDSSDILFPNGKYMYFAAISIILQKLGQTDVARECAKKSLQAASMNHSGFTRHPNVGLVKNRDKAIESKLRKIINPGMFDWLRNNRRNKS
jgi:tetratricopeptide (TPR) repeat protein